MFLFNIFLSPGNKYFTNYADNTASYVVGSNLEEVVSELKDLTQKLLGLPKTKGKLSKSLKSYSPSHVKGVRKKLKMSDFLDFAS